jgi:hypothetical protein
LEDRVNRRLFLKGAAFAALAVAAGELRKPASLLAQAGIKSQTRQALEAGPALKAAPALNTTARAQEQLILGRLLRGTSYGQIHESTDNGRSWRTIANFGSHVSVARLYEHQSEIHAQVALQGHSFVIRSADGRMWRTADAVRRSA